MHKQSAKDLCNLPIDRNTDFTLVHGTALIGVGSRVVRLTDRTMVSTPGCISGEIFFNFDKHTMPGQKTFEINFRFQITKKNFLNPNDEKN